MTQSANTNTKPVDWDQVYHISISGKTLQAMLFLADWALKHEPPLSVIGACDHLLHFQQDVRDKRIALVIGEIERLREEIEFLKRGNTLL